MAATHTVNNIIGLLGVQFKRIANDFAIRIHRKKNWNKGIINGQELHCESVSKFYAR